MIRFDKIIMQRIIQRATEIGSFSVPDFRNVIPKPDQKVKKAAVLIPLCNYNDVASVIFTVRSHDVSTHKGQVAFPGGHANEGEPHIQTAIRETREELGESIGRIRVIGCGAEVRSTTGTLVTPVLGFVEKPLTDLSLLDPCEREVAKVFVRSVQELIEPGYKIHQVSTYNNKTWTMPIFGDDAGDERIWGITAYILEGVLNDIIEPILKDLPPQTLAPQEEMSRAAAAAELRNRVASFKNDS